MNSTFKFLLGVVAIVVGAFLFVYFVDHHEPAPKQDTTIEPSEPSFYDTAFRDPDAIEQQPTELQEKESQSVKAPEVTYVPPQVPSDNLPPKPRTSAQLALKKRLDDYKSLRKPAVCDPQSPENRALVTSIVEKRKARLAQETAE